MDGTGSHRPNTDGCTVRMSPLNYKRDATQKASHKAQPLRASRSTWAEERGLVILLTVDQMSAS